MLERVGVEAAAMAITTRIIIIVKGVCTDDDDYDVDNNDKQI